MTIDFHEKAQSLLERIANSIHDRDPKNPTPFFFNINEIHAAEKWLKELERELKEDCICV